MQRLEDEVNAQFERKIATIASLPPSTAWFGGMSSSPSTRVVAKKRKDSTSVHERSFDKAFHDQLDWLIARMFYSSGLPLHFAKNPHYITSFTYAANNMFFGICASLVMICWGQVFYKVKRKILGDHCNL